MSWGFEKGKLYNRRSDIHDRFCGQRQGGIITPKQHALVIIVTGEEGLAHGYSDRWRTDGAFEYFGEGQAGDMVLLRGNLAVALHSITGKSLLLFHKVKTGLIFVDEMVYETHHEERAPDKNGLDRNAIVFELRPLSAVVESVETLEIQNGSPADFDLRWLRSCAIESARENPKSKGQGFRNVYERSKDVRRYVLARSQGHCEGCGALAPFNRKDGSPYLEPHHIRRISDGGPDDPKFVIALCPNCHRRVHAGLDGENYNETLKTAVAGIETHIERNASQRLTKNDPG